ncbi:putative secreted protein (Por secretion system target) [Chitinophaga niastensis]|uniref:Putative secreted protein (Por secretion system target) n=1 Tax=Chitinophaga niastensis TaxID=536980 RepID=A0A2P8HJE3_CHINA|nr:discoidin domain-containing protein [Chitinophaga niastensis]PSL46339.1 putative secreted protein (Por secretion system target) [Chitinophaga niastensis]
MHIRKYLSLILPACLLLSSTALAQNYGNWRNIGPVLFPINSSGQINGIGRVTQMKFHSSSASTIYATSVWGLWKSTDTANTWQLQGTDELPKAACASVCIDNTNDQIMYLGTGDPNYYGTSLGVYKTTDGGQSWLPANSSIGSRMAVEMLMSPTDHNVLVAATNDGIWKTTNGGISWTEQLVGGQFTDMTFKAVSNTVTIFAVTMDGSFYTSTNMGDTWTATTLTLPANGAKGTRVAVTPADSNRVYVTMVGSNSGSAGGVVYQSTNGGTSFTQVKGDVAPNLNGYSGTTTGQGNYNYSMCADPTNANTLYIVGHLVWKSTNGGSTWTQMESSWAVMIHTDMHGIKVDPYNTSKLFDYNDGGVWLSTDGGTTWTPKSNGLSSSEVYHASNSPIRRDMISIGTQDNGELYYKYGSNPWFTNRGGDWGARSAFDYNTNNQVYYYNGKRRSVTGSDASYNLPFTGTNNMQLEFTPQNAAISFAADTGLWRSANITAASPSWTQLVSTAEKINALHVSNASANVVYYVTTNQKVYRSRNATAASPVFTSIAAPAATSVAASVTTISSDSNVVYLACGSRMYRSADQGSTYTDISGTLPQVNVIRLLEDRFSTNESVYLATARGVYYRNKTMTDWSLYSIGLPTVADITDIFAYNNGVADSSELRVSFYGRGVFGTKLNNAITPLISFASTTIGTTAAGTSLSGCKPYTDYVVNMTVSPAPTGNANVQLVVGPTSSAIRGVDYDVTTNGNFTTTSDTLIFASGQTAPRPVTIRVYGSKTDPMSKFSLLTFSVSGTTNAMANPSAQTARVNITYPDASPVGDTARVNLTYGNGTTGGSASSPFNGTQSDKKAQTIYPADELRAAGIQKGYIYSVAYHVISRTVTTTSTFQNFNVAIAATPQTAFTNTQFDASPLTAVYGGSISVTDTGWVQIPFSQPYYWDGYSNLLIQSCYDNPDGTNQGDNLVASISVSGANPTAFQRQTSGSGCTFNAPGYGSTRPNLIINTRPSVTAVASALNISTTQYLGPNATIYFADTSGSIIAKVQNQSSFDYGCTTVKVDRAGTTSAQFWDSTAAHYLASKTVKITPTNNNTSGKVSVTLYYSQAEKTGWETATAQSWDSIKMVKVKSSVSNVTPANPYPDGAGTIDTGRDTSSKKGATIYYVTATFNTGLGGLGVGIPGTPPVITACNTPIPRTQLRVYQFDSQEIVGESAPVTNVIDGDINTYWHTQWYNATAPMPHYVAIYLGGGYDLSKLTYVPRQAGVNGRINAYQVQVSTDSLTWTQVATGNFVNSTAAQDVVFNPTVKAKYVKLIATSEVNGNAWTSIGELSFTGCPDNTMAPMLTKMAANIKVYPTMVQRGGNINIRDGASRTIIVRLYDVKGRMLKVEHISGAGSINTSDLPAGIYMYNIFNSKINPTKQVTSGKIVVVE